MGYHTCSVTGAIILTDCLDMEMQHPGDNLVTNVASHFIFSSHLTGWAVNIKWFLLLGYKQARWEYHTLQ